MADVYANVQNVLKENYASDAASQTNDYGIIYKRAKKENKLGRAFNAPIVVSNAAGMTTNTAGSNTQALKGSVGPDVVDARVPSVSYVLESVVSREDMERGETEGKSVETVPALTGKQLKKSFVNLCEGDAFYGLHPWGLAASAVAAPTTVVVTLQSKSWAIGLWRSLLGGKVFFAGLAANRPLLLTAISPTDKSLQFTEITAGDAALVGALVAGQTIYPFHMTSSATPIAMQGLYNVIGPSSATSIYGLSTTTYPQVVSFRDTAFGEVTIKKLVDLASRTGCTEELDVYLSPRAYSCLEGAENYQDIGFKADHMVLKGTNLIHVFSHPSVKEDHIFVVPSDSLKWIATNNVGLLKLAKDNYAQGKEGTDSYFMRIALNIAVITNQPGMCAFAEGIVYP